VNGCGSTSLSTSAPFFARGATGRRRVRLPPRLVVQVVTVRDVVVDDDDDISTRSFARLVVSSD